jgi:phosphatidylserine/phosphatidylglycerophosphate/cardiolipin synthase-like enzyme
MKRSTASYSSALIVFLALAAAQLYLRHRGSLPSLGRTIVPVSVPGAAPVEGPYFSDGDRVAERIVAAINHTQKSLHVAIYDLTEADITAAIDAAHRRGVDVRIVADEGQAREPHSQVRYLQSQGIAVRLSRGYRGNRSIMHDKFAVFDARLVETGSFNWTTSADRYNYENALFIAEPGVAARYEREFERIWDQAE